MAPYLNDCDALQDANCAQIYKGFLLAIFDIDLALDRATFQWMDEIKKRAELSRLSTSMVNEGLIFPGEEVLGFEVNG